MHKPPYSLKELKFYFYNFSSHSIGCSRQELRLIRTVFMAVQFFLPWYLSGDIKGTVNFLHSFEGAWREPRPCCVQRCAHLWQKSIRLASLHPSTALTSIAFEPHEFDVGVSFMYLLVHLGRIAAAYTRRSFTKAAKRLR